MHLIYRMWSKPIILLEARVFGHGWWGVGFSHVGFSHLSPSSMDFHALKMVRTQRVAINHLTEERLHAGEQGALQSRTLLPTHGDECEMGLCDLYSCTTPISCELPRSAWGAACPDQTSRIFQDKSLKFDLRTGPSRFLLLWFVDLNHASGLVSSQYGWGRDCL